MQYRCIESRTTADGQHRHRAYCRVPGTRERARGPWRATRREAHDDYCRMRADAERLRGRPADLTIRDAVARSLEVCRAGGAQEITVDRLRLRLNRLTRFFREDAGLDEISADDIRWLVQQRRAEDGVSNTTLAHDLKALSKMWRDAGLADRNPVAAVARPRRDDVVREVLDWDVAFGLIDRIRALGTRASQRQADVYAVLLLTGVRLHELIRVTARDIEFRGDCAVLRIAGKGRRFREALVFAPHDQAVRRLALAAGGGPLIPGGKGWLGSALASLSKRLGVKINGRILRRTYGTRMEQVAGLAMARDGLGHRNIAMTSRYLVGSDARLADATRRMQSG